VTVTGENDPPYPPTDPIPEHEATDVDVNTDLSWTCSDPDDHDLVYDVYFEADDTTPDVLVSDDQTENSYDPGTMTYETTYYWQIVAKDEYGAFTSGPVWHFTTAENQPPSAPNIDGKTSGKAGTPYTYKFTSTDPNGDQVSYYIKWGDGDITDWTTPQASGTPYSEIHIWDVEDSYRIEAKAKDTFGLESDWAELTVTMPRNRAFNFNLNLLQGLLELFPILQKILYFIL
jgi:hypothetical protein